MTEGQRRFMQAMQDHESFVDSKTCCAGTHRCLASSVGGGYSVCGVFDECDCGMDMDYGDGHCRKCFHQKVCHAKQVTA